MNGRTHAVASYALALPVGVAVGLYLLDPRAGVLAAIGCAAGVLLSPDLDQESLTESEALVYRRGGSLPGHLWRAYWMLYSLVLPHRSPLSHWPVLGTAGRLLYLLLPAIAWSLWAGRGLELAMVLYAAWPASLGLAVSDLAHWLMDAI